MSNKFRKDRSLQPLPSKGVLLTHCQFCFFAGKLASYNSFGKRTEVGNKTRFEKKGKGKKESTKEGLNRFAKKGKNKSTFLTGKYAKIIKHLIFAISILIGGNRSKTEGLVKYAFFLLIKLRFQKFTCLQWQPLHSGNGH